MSDYIQQTSNLAAISDENEVPTAATTKKNKTVKTLNKNKCHLCSKFFTK